jgi:salicylate hydroxylase
MSQLFDSRLSPLGVCCQRVCTDWSDNLSQATLGSVPVLHLASEACRSDHDPGKHIAIPFYQTSFVLCARPQSFTVLLHRVYNMASPKPFRITICGAGIAGISAAIALRASGRQITVLEQSSLASEIGASISLQPNASRILQEEWKVDGLRDAGGTVDQGFRIFNVQGKMVNSIPLLTKTAYGGDRVMYHRQDLHTALKRAATATRPESDPVTIRTSSKVVSCDCSSGTVRLETGEVIEADMVVAADGIHSVLRKYVLEEDVMPVPTGLSAYRFMVPSAMLADTAPTFCENIDPRQPYTSMMMAHDCRLIMGPVRDGDLYSMSLA